MNKSKTEEKQKIVHFRYFFYPFLAFLFGIIVARRLYRGDIEIAVITVIVLAAIILLLLLRKKFVPLAVLLCLFFVGNGFYYLGSLSFDCREYHENVAVVGRVTDDIDEGLYGYTVLLDDVKVNGRNERKVKLYIQNCVERPVPGTIVAFEGKLNREKPFTLKSFNSSAYRSGARYNASVKLSALTALEGGYCKVDEKIRIAVKNLLNKNMSEDSAAVAYALLFGDKNDVDPAITSTYKNSGIIHILTVSGLHVGFLVALFYKLLNKLRVNRYVLPVLVTAFILFYAYLCGFSPAVLRAGFMAIIMMLSKTFYRNYDRLNSLGLAGFLICIIRPLSALDIGFLMSFFCVYSLIVLCPVLTNLFNKFLPTKIASLISVSLSAQIGILPFLAYFGSQVHLLAFAVNFIVIPILSIAYPYLFVVSMFGTFLPFLGYLLVPVDYVLRFIYLIARFFEWSHLTVPVSADFFGVFMLVFVTIFFASGHLMKSAFKKFVLVAASTLVMTFALGFYQIPSLSKSNIAFISSGTSQSIVLTNSNREKLVIGYDYLLVRYQRNYMVGNFDAYISIDGTISGYYTESLSKLGCKSFVANKSMTEKRVETIPTNEIINVGKFGVCYAEDEGKLLGTFIIMDSTRIFVANGTNLSYNILENVYFNIFKPDIVFTGENAWYDANRDYVVVSLDENAGSDYSFESDGNLLIKTYGNNLKIRGLD